MATEKQAREFTIASPVTTSATDENSSVPRHSKDHASTDDSVIDYDKRVEDGREAVSRIDAVNEVLTTRGRFTIFGENFYLLKVILLFFLFLQGYATGLDGLLSGSMQTYASNWFKASGESGSINTVKSVVAAAVLVPYARLSDRFGRIEMWIVALIIFLVGRIVTAATPTFGGLFAGTIVWQFGYAGFRILATTLLADISQLRDRTFAMNIYLIPIIINLWVSGDMVSGLIGARNEKLGHWRWGYGIFCIVVPFTTALLVCVYGYAQYVAWRQRKLPPLRLKRPGQSFGGAVWELIMDIDLIGMLLFAAVLVLILLPLTIAGGLNTKWRRAYIIAMICVGGGLIPVFILWEWKFAKAPFVPKAKLDRTFYIAMIHEFCWRLALSAELNYVRFLLLVAFDQSSKSAQRLGQFYDFMQASTNIVIGVLLHFYPRPKLSVVIGGLLGVVGFGIMYKYRTHSDGGIAGFIGAEVVVGIAGGMMRFPLYTLVHSGIDHDQMAVSNGFLSTMYNVGAAVGSCVGTAIWTQKMPKELVKRLGPQLGMQVYKSPISFLKKYPLNTPQRNQILEAYSSVQRILVIVAISFSALVAVLNFFVRNYKVGKKQSLSDEDREKVRQEIRNSKNGWFRELVGY